MSGGRILSGFSLLRPVDGEDAERNREINRRRFQIISGMALGKTQPEIAASADISSFTVVRELTRLYAETGTRYPPELVRRAYLAHFLDEVDPGEHAPVRLTVRRMEVLRLQAEGLGQQQVAKTLGVGPPTVQGHAHGIRSLFGVQSMNEAVFLALRQMDEGHPLVVLRCSLCETEQKAPWEVSSAWVEESGWIYSRRQARRCPQCVEAGHAKTSPRRFRKLPCQRNLRSPDVTKWVVERREAGKLLQEIVDGLREEWGLKTTVSSISKRLIKLSRVEGE